MNKLRVLCLGLVVLLSGLFVSCQSPQPSGPVQWAGVVKVNMNGTFSDMAGVVLVPNPPSFLDASMAYIYCEFTPNSAVNNKMNIQLLAEPEGIDQMSYVVQEPDAVNDVKANAAIYDLRTAVAGGTGYIPAFFDAQTLVLPINFFLKNTTDPAALRAEAALHSFPLVCYVSSVASGDTELKLYMRHVVMGDVSTPRTTNMWFFRAYSLTNALQMFKAQSGNEKPMQVVIYYEQNFISDQLTSSHTTQKRFEIPYTF